MVTPGNLRWKWRVGGEINAQSWARTELWVEIDCDRSTSTWPVKQLGADWLVIRKHMRINLWLADNNGARDKIHVCSLRGGKSIARISHVSGVQGSIELNINSSLCFSKNSHLLRCKSVMRHKWRKHALSMFYTLIRHWFSTNQSMHIL